MEENPPEGFTRDESLAGHKNPGIFCLCPPDIFPSGVKLVASSGQVPGRGADRPTLVTAHRASAPAYCPHSSAPRTSPPLLLIQVVLNIAPLPPCTPSLLNPSLLHHCVPGMLVCIVCTSVVGGNLMEVEQVTNRRWSITLGFFQSFDEAQFDKD